LRVTAIESIGTLKSGAWDLKGIRMKRADKAAKTPSKEEEKNSHSSCPTLKFVLLALLSTYCTVRLYDIAGLFPEHIWGVRFEGITALPRPWPSQVTIRFRALL
jgi:hypothetical protein